MNHSSPSENIELIHNFYNAFANANAEEMVACYDDNISFEDPAFGILRGNDAKNMWRMLIDRSKGNIKINFRNVMANETSGSADWVAEYVFGQTGRKVINSIHAQFEFKNGRIIKHNDSFDFWKWTQQAFGIKGYLLGWTGFMRNKIREGALEGLKKFSGK